MKLADVTFQTFCCGNSGSAELAEIEVPSGWVRIIKSAIGGFKVSRFGANKMPTHAEVQMSKGELEALLALA
jgi:hypothetical protein